MARINQSITEDEDDDIIITPDDVTSSINVADTRQHPFRIVTRVIFDKQLWLIFGPLFGAITALTLCLKGFDMKIANTTGACFWMVSWWLVGPVRLGLTSLLPIAIFPILGVLPGK